VHHRAQRPRLGKRTDKTRALAKKCCRTAGSRNLLGEDEATCWGRELEDRHRVLCAFQRSKRLPGSGTNVAVNVRAGMWFKTNTRLFCRLLDFWRTQTMKELVDTCPRAGVETTCRLRGLRPYKYQGGLRMVGALAAEPAQAPSLHCGCRLTTKAGAVQDDHA